MTDRERREVLALMAAGAAMASGVTAAQTADSRAAEVPAVFAVNRQPKPLRFDPAKLNGLSEKLIRSHWENNYVGSVRTLNLVTERQRRGEVHRRFHEERQLGGSGQALHGHCQDVMAFTSDGLQRRDQHTRGVQGAIVSQRISNLLILMIPPSDP